MAQGAVKKSGKRSQAVSAKKEAILAAALEAFSQFGIHGTRLEQVAELAGVSKTNLLYYYPSKEALDAAGMGAAEATMETFAQLDELLAASLPATTPATRK